MVGVDSGSLRASLGTATYGLTTTASLFEITGVLYEQSGLVHTGVT